MQKIHVRVATSADAQALLDLRQRVFGESEFLLWEPAEFEDTVEQERSSLERLSASANSTCLVAYEGEAMVGFLNAMGGVARRQKHSTKLALAVAKSHWGQGVGAALIQAFQVWVCAAGLARAELTVHVTNLRALTLYLRFGFEVEGVRRRSLKVEGRWIDEYQMAWLVPDLR